MSNTTLKDGEKKVGVFIDDALSKSEKTTQCMNTADKTLASAKKEVKEKGCSSFRILTPGKENS